VIAIAQGFGRRPGAPAEAQRHREALALRERTASHHYWHERYVTPKLRACGAAGADDLWFQQALRLCRDARRARLVSLGAGSCAAEVLLASRLVEWGAADFTLTCVDPSPHRLARGRQLAQRCRVLPRLRFEVAEVVHWKSSPGVAACIVVDCLHRCPTLEGLLARLDAALDPEGVLLVQDWIGRSGRALWPEAAAIVERLWPALPERYQFDHTLRRRAGRFVNRDRRADADDGARSEDVLPLLLERFHFDVFAACGNVIDVFVGDAFGPNLDPHRPADRGFLDEVALLDEGAIDAGILKPTHMVAALRRQPADERRYFGRRSPEFCARYAQAGATEGLPAPVVAALTAPVLLALAELHADARTA
jgi:SAM-dependent methyltransferase